MGFVNVTERNSKELESIKKKISKLVKGVGCNVGEIRWSNTGLMHHVEVDNDGKIGEDYIADIIRKSPTARLCSVEEHREIYDWKADVYVRPVSIVSFAF